MKKAAIVLSALLCLCLTIPTQAQLSKKERKEWKKQMKRLDPAEFKSLVEEKEALEGEARNLRTQMNSIQSGAKEKEQKIEQLQNQLKDAHNQLAEAKASLTKLQEDNSMDISGQGAGTRIAKGVLFKVQIGAFRNKDLAKYFNQNGSFDGEVDNSLQQYTLGTFQDYWDADKFKKYLRDMGVKDAWIVAYKDGARVPLKDVLEGVL